MKIALLTVLLLATSCATLDSSCKDAVDAAEKLVLEQTFRHWATTCHELCKQFDQNAEAVRLDMQELARGYVSLVECGCAKPKSDKPIYPIEQKVF